MARESAAGFTLTHCDREELGTTVSCGSGGDGKRPARMCSGKAVPTPPNPRPAGGCQGLPSDCLGSPAPGAARPPPAPGPHSRFRRGLGQPSAEPTGQSVQRLPAPWARPAGDQAPGRSWWGRWGGGALLCLLCSRRGARIAFTVRPHRVGSCHPGPSPWLLGGGTGTRGWRDCYPKHGLMENKRGNFGERHPRPKFQNGTGLTRGLHLPTCSQCSCLVGSVHGFPALPHPA